MLLRGSATSSIVTPRCYLIRRVGVDEAATMVGEVFRIAFEKRSTFDLDHPSARPWLYGIATNLVARRQRSEARRDCCVD